MADVECMRNGWAWLLEHTTESQLKTWVTFLVHEIFYWGAHIPFFIASFTSTSVRYKLQPKQSVTREAFLHCAWRVFLNHVLLILPIIALTHPVYSYLGTRHELEHLPTLRTIIIHVIFCFILEDIVFYFGHRLLHTPYLYRTIHSVHHHHSAPFGIAAEYAHPIEVLFLGTATLAGPLVLSPHLLTQNIYLALRCLQTVECHSGYDFPWSINRWFPLYGGAEFHDHHHRVHSGNYASTFIWIDWLFGTDSAYREWRRRRARDSCTKKDFDEHSEQGEIVKEE